MIPSVSHETPELRSEKAHRAGERCRWLALAAGLSLGVVAWEYLLNAWTNPDVDWNPLGVAAHMALDLVLVAPLLALALGAGLALGRRLGLAKREPAGLLGTAGVVAVAVLVVVLPLTSSRDLAHEWLGATYGLSLAEVQVRVVSSELTVDELTQLCSFGSLRNPGLARDDAGFETPLTARLAAGFGDALVQQAALLPLLVLGLWALYLRRLPRWSPVSRIRLRRAPALRLGALASLATAALFCVGYGLDRPGSGAAHALPATDEPFDACTGGGPRKEYRVHAIDVEITLNRWGDHVRGGHMYALQANVPAIRDFEAALDRDRADDDDFGNHPARVSAGLRRDPIQPLVLRANLGECLVVHFTNDLTDGEPASMHILGLPHTVDNAGSAVGENPDTMAAAGETITYEIPLPPDPTAERAYYFHDHGAGRRRQNMGLFGAIVAEPRGATYLDVETGAELDTVTGSNWEAIILDPNLEGLPDGKSFREFVIFYHEIGDEAFTDIRDRGGKKLPLVDDVAGVYRPAARALNYRSEPFRRRIEQDRRVNGELAGHGKGAGYNSYSFGDPATPIPRSYVGEGVKTRLLHGGSEVFHVHHLHGGGDRWRRNPNADPENDFWKGLTKVPDPNLTSIHLDSQSIGPGTSYNLEHECGAGGCQQGVGEFLYHCHIGHHYISGMWSFWRVFGTVQSAETNVNGHPLYVEPALFQGTENPLLPTSEPEMGVSAGELVGTVVDDHKVLVQQVTDPETEVGLEAWIRHMLPPQGVPFDNGDATVWDWMFGCQDGSVAADCGALGIASVYGEPESTDPFPGWVSASPGERPEILWNPKNARYTWPLFRPHNSKRPIFTARHSGAPWLGEEMKPGRLDGLCAVNGVDPAVDVGPTAVQRYYPVSAISLPIQVTADRADPDGMIFALNEEIDPILANEAAVAAGGELDPAGSSLERKRAEPLAIRSNVGDCVELVFTNQIPDGPLNKNFSKVNIHSHLVQFDTQASDGVMTGFSYEQSVRPFAGEDRRLSAPASAGDTTLRLNHVQRLHPEILARNDGRGIWIGIGLGEGTCGTDDQVYPQPVPCTEVRQVTAIDGAANTVSFDRPLAHDHRAGEAVGVEFVRYNWYSDVDVGTVFFHTHVEFKDWDHGLFGTHIVEPRGSTYHDPVTGEEIRSGTLADIRVDPEAGGNPVAYDVDGSFREFMLFLHNQSPVEGPFARGGGTINLRAEPWRRRGGDPAWRFSSVTHGDPWTQQIRTYVGDPLVVRGMGLVERVGGIRFAGHRFHQERTSAASDVRDATFIGISERFDVSLEGGAGGPGGYPGDYLFYSTLGRDFESGAWGILRVHDTLQGTLQPLPDREPPPSGAGFPQLSFTGEAPPPSYGGPGDPCPAGAPEREYVLEITDATIVYNDLRRGDLAGVAYRRRGAGGEEVRTPVVMRAAAGECLVVSLFNERSQRSGIHVGELVFDPQGSYGSAIGFNRDTTVSPGGGKQYRYWADKELGIVLAMNLADVDSVEHGAFAAVVVEPEGASWSRPGGGRLPQGGIGLQADVVGLDPADPSLATREVVAIFNDQDRRIGANAMPYPAAVANFNGINYSNEPLDLRGMRRSPAEVFRSERWGDPRQVVEVRSGSPLVFRVAQAWGNQPHVPTLEGHRWLLEPGMAGSEELFDHVLVPGMSMNYHYVGGAGGDIQAPGDYLFLDRRQPFMEGGLWFILRATPEDTPRSVTTARPRRDRVIVDQVLRRDDGTLEVLGRTTLRPAGDFAAAVTIDDCSGNVLGTAEVEAGSGAFRFAEALGSAPGEICVTSTVGGTATATVM